MNEERSEMRSEGAGAPSPKSGNWSDLSKRLVSALVLAAVTLFVTFSGAVPFAAIVAFGGGILAWEWGRLVRGSDVDELLVLHVISVLAACALTLYGQAGVALLVLIVGPALKFAFADDRQARNLGLSLLGVPYTGLPLVALIWLRLDPAYGWPAILYLYLTVWSVDIFAYVAGRSIGGPKLAPAISPKKTWSGFIGGVSAGALVGGLFGQLMGGTSPLVLALVSLGIGILAQIGDLFESAFKRHFGIKDASNLIPGHGGLLDRVDGLMFAAVAAALIALYFGFDAPGRNLLVWRMGS